MKKKKMHLTQLTNKVLGLILVLLGFSSCSEEDGGYPDPIICEYGMPYAHYTIKGKVINESKEAVSNIQLIVKYVTNQKYTDKDDYLAYPLDTVYSDKNGEFIWEDGYGYQGKYRLIHSDGHKDGIVYKTDSTFVEMGVPTGGEGWFRGHSTKNVTIKLNKK